MQTLRGLTSQVESFRERLRPDEVNSSASMLQQLKNLSEVCTAVLSYNIVSADGSSTNIWLSSEAVIADASTAITQKLGIPQYLQQLFVKRADPEPLKEDQVVRKAVTQDRQLYLVQLCHHPPLIVCAAGRENGPLFHKATARIGAPSVLA